MEGTKDPNVKYTWTWQSLLNKTINTLGNVKTGKVGSCFDCLVYHEVAVDESRFYSLF